MSFVCYDRADSKWVSMSINVHISLFVDIVAFSLMKTRFLLDIHLYIYVHYWQ